jgi:hypothetical protein
MPGRSDNEKHPGRDDAPVSESMRAARRHEHETARTAPDGAGAVGRLPRCPVRAGAGPRLEGEQIKLAFQDVEHLLGVPVQVRADVKAGGDGGLEHRPPA